MELEEVVKILDEADYRVRVRGDGDGIVVDVPANLGAAGRPDPVRQALSVHRGDVQGVTIEVDGGEAEFVPIPEYAIRCVLSGFLSRVCESIEYPASLVEYAFEDGGAATGLRDLVAGPLDVDRERLLEGLIADGLARGFTPAVRDAAEGLDVGREFDMCRTFYGESN